MKFELEKLLQNVELRLRGRTAMVAISQGVMAISLWLVMRDYTAHPVLSTIGVMGLLIGILGLPVLGLLGEARPEEVPEKSLTHVTNLGVVIAHGISSHKDMVQLMRELSGIKKLPLPSDTVRGPASNERNYIPLTPEQSKTIVEHVEQGVEKLLSDAIERATTQPKQLQLQGLDLENPEKPPGLEGKMVKTHEE